jgi:hypothetical protein
VGKGQDSVLLCFEDEEKIRFALGLQSVFTGGLHLENRLENLDSSLDCDTV